MPDYNISDIMKQIEDDLIASMKRNLAGHELEEEVEGFKWEQWQSKKLRELVKYQKRNRKILNLAKPKLSLSVKFNLLRQYLEAGKKTDKECSSVIKKGFSLKRKHPTDAFFSGDNRKLNSLIKSVNGDMDKASYAALRKMDDVYRQTIFRAEMFAGSGTKTVAQAVDMATKDFLAKGIDCITYSNGARVNINSYATMAIRTANKRAHLMGEGERRKEWGESLVLVSQYGQCSPLCKPWQGKVYIDDVYSGGKAEDGPYPLLSTAIRGHLFHPNCRHTMSTYFEGISVPPEPMSNENEAYENVQKQADATRNARKYERLKNGSFDTDNVKKYTDKEKQWQNIVDKEKVANYKAPSVPKQKDLSKMTLEELRKESEKEAIKYYKSGKSGISFGNSTQEEAARSLSQLGSKTSLTKDIKSLRKKNLEIANQAKSAIMELSDTELGALTKYKSFESYKINDELRNVDDISELSTESQMFVKELDKALAKTPTYEGNLIRTVDFTSYADSDERLKVFLDEFVKEDTITAKQYWSTSKEDGYSNTANIKIYIQNSSKGHDISKVGLDESEVLYERNTKFKVINKVFDDGMWNILLQEV